ncbi:MAG: LLM class flavin-dependent oxidoreductase [Alphaproteobacteria bacterium]|jgi:alkanesulfonate monooxygenase SsuD/methylene tetrahydromethanopterin reductase-like flavin-dependent oxidoreductase (luciferase family)|nr:LLM class flavin-dependent oxidoreductase [Alphaproteobacteria bacterium]
MRFGNFLFPESRAPERDGQVIDETLAEARLSDELGIEALWLAEHHFDGNCAYVDPVSFAAAVAATTSRVRIGFAVAQVSLHHPIRLAEQMALLDNLSHGRLIIGLGRGTAHNIYEYLGYDIDPGEAQERLLEAEAVMLEAWSTENFEHRGKYWNLTLPLLRPRPYTKPHPYVIRAASSEDSMLALAREGRPFLMNVQSNEATAARLALYRRSMFEAGHDEATVAACVEESWIWRNVFVAGTDAEAERIGLPAFEAQAEHRARMRKRIYAERGLEMHREVEPASRNRAGAALIAGSPATVTEKIAAIDDIGVGGLIMSFRLGPMAHEDATDSLRLFMAEVAPQFGGGSTP